MLYLTIAIQYEVWYTLSLITVKWYELQNTPLTPLQLIIYLILRFFYRFSSFTCFLSWSDCSFLIYQSLVLYQNTFYLPEAKCIRNILNVLIGQLLNTAHDVHHLRQASTLERWGKKWRQCCMDGNRESKQALNFMNLMLGEQNRDLWELRQLESLKVKLIPKRKWGSVTDLVSSKA